MHDMKAHINANTGFNHAYWPKVLYQAFHAKQDMAARAHG